VRTLGSPSIRGLGEQRRRVLLFADRRVPEFDRDAGSKFTYHYLRLFADLGFEVLFLPGDFQRREPYATELEEAGITVLSGDWYAHNIGRWLEQTRDRVDYAYLCRPEVGRKYLQTLRVSSSIKIIYCAADLHYLRFRREYEVSRRLRSLLAAIRAYRVETRLFRDVDVIHVVSHHEAALVAREVPGKPIRVMPVYVFDAPCRDSPPYEERAGILFVGGFEHAPNRDAVRWFVAEVFPKIAIELPDVTFHIIGSDPPPEVRALAGERIALSSGVTDDDLTRFYAHSRVAVAPLRYGAGVKGKVVEAMYHGVPVVTTPVGAEGLIEAEDCIAIGAGAPELAQRVIEVYAERERWLHLSSSAQAYVDRFFSREAAVEQLSRDFDLVSGRSCGSCRDQ